MDQTFDPGRQWKPANLREAARTFSDTPSSHFSLAVLMNNVITCVSSDLVRCLYALPQSLVIQSNPIQSNSFIGFISELNLALTRACFETTGNYSLFALYSTEGAPVMHRPQW